MNATEEKILNAAEQVFMKQGYDGSRMQAIADLAGINKAMLHYYFRSKDQLFERIFKEKFSSFFPTIEELLEVEMSFTEKICLFAEKYIDFLIKNPYLPHFVLNSLHKNPEFAKNLPLQLPKILLVSYLEDAEKGKCRMMNPVQLFMSVLGICVFPFLARPMFKSFLGAEDDEFMELMQQRKEEVKQQIRFLLKIDN
jgi:TetR/AcrR family transcriptional regulator